MRPSAESFRVRRFPSPTEFNLLVVSDVDFAENECIFGAVRALRKGVDNVYESWYRCRRRSIGSGSAVVADVFCFKKTNYCVWN